MPKSIGNIKKTKTKKVVHNRPTAPERVKVNNFAFFNIISFELKRKLYILLKNVSIQICRSFCSKQYCTITFCRISYNLTKKWNIGIDFFQVLTLCNFPNFGSNEKYYYDN